MILEQEEILKDEIDKAIEEKKKNNLERFGVEVCPNCDCPAFAHDDYEEFVVCRRCTYLVKGERI